MAFDPTFCPGHHSREVHGVRLLSNAKGKILLHHVLYPLPMLHHRMPWQNDPSHAANANVPPSVVSPRDFSFKTDSF